MLGWIEVGLLFESGSGALGTERAQLAVQEHPQKNKQATRRTWRAYTRSAKSRYARRAMDPTPKPLQIAILTISDSRTLETDKSGALLMDQLMAAGHVIAQRTIIKDDLPKIREAIDFGVKQQAIDVVITTGGTGITKRDVTPEALAPLVTKWIPGFGELFRSLSYADIGAATIQSRAEAALCDTTLVFILPGSTGAVKLALEKIIVPQLDARTKPCNFVELLPRVHAEG
ncbi:MAG TPA: molybdenum cofactor biosynthesis protein B [Polyangiaceae bacterium]